MEVKKLTIIQINDVHGHVEPHNEVFFESDGLKVREAGGYSRIKTLVDEIRSEKNMSIEDYFTEVF